MGLILWIIFGVVAGWITSVIVKTNRQQGIVGDIVLGIIGAIIGGAIMSVLGQPGVEGLNLYSLAVAVLGAVVVVFAYRKLLF
ncbi:MAG: Transglycosylase-associated protein [Microgenomates group bacterium GW2011_GWA2_44_7]|nr:MAG: Transglycosylase-associated protein [Microgenomates group bacterium GW2011_GWA2_44_7]KKT77520.1 MAG: Transglycosylase-associated protein [Microgenomates group bacterium GW2011_GWB1_44_8]KKW02822.1 MAG: Transglycosylase-associated protein [Parcubacteria group bacterium GW2011_GWA1_49_11]